MSQVQKYSCLDTKTIAPPIAFLGLALLAGRFIQYFPKTSQRDLLIAAGAASVTSAIYDCAVHKPDHNSLQTLLGKAAAIAVATLGTALTAKALNGRADLSFRSIARFGAIEFVAAAIITFATRESSLQRQHHHYTTHQKEWRALTPEARMDLVKQFYKAGLPAISLFETELAGDHEWLDRPETVYENLKSYSGAQLSWYRELFQQHNMTPTLDQYFRFMERCHETGIEMLRCQLPESPMLEEEDLGFDMPPLHQHQQGRVIPVKMDPERVSDGEESDGEGFDLGFAEDPQMRLPHQQGQRGPLLSAMSHQRMPRMWSARRPTQSIPDFLQDNPHYTAMLYKEFQKTPIYRFFCETPNRYRGPQGVDFSLLFKDNPPLPTLEQAMQQLDAAQVETMDPSLLQMWHYVFQREAEQLDSLSEPVQAAFVQRFSEYEAFHPIRFPSPGNLSWINALSQDDLDHLSENQGQWLEMLLHGNPDVVIEFHIAHALNTQHRMRVPYHLTHEVVAQAQSDEIISAALKEQFGGYGRRDEDYGFSKLSFADQKALKNLFDEDRQHLPSYQLSAEVVFAVEQGDETLLADLKEQFEGVYHEEDYGFLELSAGDQGTLRVAFGEEASLLPYKITSALVARAQQEPQLVAHLKQQFRNSGGRDYGFLELSAEDQGILRVAFGEHYALQLPYKITPELVAQAQHSEQLVAHLKQQFQSARGRHYFGFYELPPQNQQDLRTLFEDSARYLPYRFTPELVAEAGQQPELLAVLVAQFKEGRGYHNHREDYGFSLLPKGDQSALRKLFGSDSFYLDRMW